MVSPELYTIDSDEFDEMSGRIESRYNLDPLMEVTDIEARLMSAGDLSASFPVSGFASRYHWTMANQAIAAGYGSQPEHDYRIAETEYTHWIGEQERLASRLNRTRDDGTAALFMVQYIEAMRQSHLWRLSLENISGRVIPARHIEVRKIDSRAALERAIRAPPEDFERLEHIPEPLPPLPEPEEEEVTEEDIKRIAEEQSRAAVREAAEKKRARAETFLEEEARELEEKRRKRPVMDTIEEMIRRDRERRRREEEGTEEEEAAEEEETEEE